MGGFISRMAACVQSAALQERNQPQAERPEDQAEEPAGAQLPGDFELTPLREKFANHLRAAKLLGELGQLAGDADAFLKALGSEKLLKRSDYVSCAEAFFDMLIQRLEGTTRAELNLVPPLHALALDCRHALVSLGAWTDAMQQRLSHVERNQVADFDAHAGFLSPFGGARAGELPASGAFIENWRLLV